MLYGSAKEWKRIASSKQVQKQLSEGVPYNFAEFIRKQLCQSIKKETLVVFFFFFFASFAKFSKHVFIEHLRVTVSTGSCCWNTFIQFRNTGSNFDNKNSRLTHSKAMFHFYTPFLGGYRYGTLKWINVTNAFNVINIDTCVTLFECPLVSLSY